MLEIIHPEPFHGIGRDEWVADMRHIQSGLSAGRMPERTMVEVMALVASLSREGRDGHQFAIPIEGGPMLPIRVFEFSDGLFVTDALDQALIGARLTSIAGLPVNQVLDLLEPLVPRDSPATVPAFRSFFLLRADVLEGLGLIEDDARVDLTLERDGNEIDTSVETIGQGEFDDWVGRFGIFQLPARDGLRFTPLEPLLRTERLDDGTLYVGLREVQSVPSSQVAAISAALEDPAVTRVVFDLRHNLGGNNQTYPHLLSVIRGIEQPLWVLTDRHTFSAAANLATEIEQTTAARFAGEPMGGGLNFWNDVQFIDLDHLPIPLSVGVSTRYWQKSTADDARLTIEPDLVVPYLSGDYFSGTDAVLEAVLRAP